MEKRKVKKRTLRYIACLEKLFLQEDLAAVLEQFSGLEVQLEGPEADDVCRARGIHGIATALWAKSVSPG